MRIREVRSGVRGEQSERGAERGVFEGSLGGAKQEEG